jgi:hypothetical protein
VVAYYFTCLLHNHPRSLLQTSSRHVLSAPPSSRKPPTEAETAHNSFARNILQGTSLFSIFCSAALPVNQRKQGFCAQNMGGGTRGASFVGPSRPTAGCPPSRLRDGGVTLFSPPLRPLHGPRPAPATLGRFICSHLRLKAYVALPFRPQILRPRPEYRGQSGASRTSAASSRALKNSMSSSLAFSPSP